MPPRRVGLDNDGLFPLALSPIETMKWAQAQLAGTELSSLIHLGEVTAGQASCRPIDRHAWAEVCESRLAQDLIALRTLSRSIPRGRA
jgi:hypothetical protein